MPFHSDDVGDAPARIQRERGDIRLMRFGEEQN